MTKVISATKVQLIKKIRKVMVRYLKARFHVGAKIEFDRAMKFLKDENIKADTISFVDIGANIGQNLLAIQKYRRAGQNVRYRGFEMMPEIFKELKKNASEIACGQDCKVYNYGISSCSGESIVREAPVASWNSLNNKNWAGKEIPVSLVNFYSIKDQLNLSGICIAKIDVEGHEIEVLKGMENAMKESVFQIIFMEAGSNPEDPQHSDFIKLCTLMRNYGYRLSGIFDIFSYRHEDWKYHYSVGFCNLMFVKEGFSESVLSQ